MGDSLTVDFASLDRAQSKFSDARDAAGFSSLLSRPPSAELGDPASASALGDVLACVRASHDALVSSSKGLAKTVANIAEGIREEDRLLARAVR